MNFKFAFSWIAVASLTIVGAAAYGQEADEDPANESEDIEEIIVVAPKPGSRRHIDQVYEDPLRARILRDLYEMEVLEEEYEWRRSAADSSPARIKWGYDPTNEYRMRNEMALRQVSWENSKPATIMSINF